MLRDALDQVDEIDDRLVWEERRSQTSSDDDEVDGAARGQQYKKRAGKSDTTNLPIFHLFSMFNVLMFGV